MVAIPRQNDRTGNEFRTMRISSGVIGLSLLIAVAILVFDVLTPKGVAAAVPYVGLILLSRRTKYPSYAFYLAGIATALTIAGYFLSPDGDTAFDLANRGLAIFAIWLTASLCHQHIEMVLKLDDSNKTLTKTVLETVSENVQTVAELQSEREDRKKAEGELQDVEERYAAIFNQTFQLVAVLDTSGRIEEANDTFIMSCGQHRNEVQDQPIWSLEALVDRPEFQDRLRSAVDAAANGNFSRTEIEFTDANGTTLTMDASLKPIRDAEGQIHSVIFEARDITEHRLNQEMLQQAQKTEVIGQLTSGVAHDFNNILAVISGHLEISAARSQSEESRKEHLESALDAVFRGRELTQQLLSFSRKRRLQRRAVDTAELVEESLKLVDLALLNDVEISTDIAEPTWPVLSDPTELQTAILNLIVNSKDSMPEGGTITVKTANLKLDDKSVPPGLTLDPGDYVLLSIIDEGTGIAPEIVNRITEPYYTTKSQGSGTGLGLSMVSQFARQTGGTMHIASTVGIGTTVSLYLPRSYETDRDSVTAGNDRLLESDTEHSHILVVEDDAGVRSNVVMMLQEMGFDVTDVETGDEALDLLRDNLECDLVFSDIALPGSYSGRDLALEIPKLGRSLKVLLTTGVPDHAQDDELAKIGVPVLPKPYRYQELASAIRSVLNS